MDMNLNPVNAAAQAMNAPAESAQGLASLGRNNDSMLMHVTPNEVQGLQQLAQNMGGSLTRNPQTGLPEAGFFDFIGNALPTIAAIGVGAMTGNPQLAGLAAGTTKTIQTGDIGAGILSGFGAYMGADAIKGVENFGANAVSNAATDTVGDFAVTPSMVAENPTGFANAAALNSASVPAQTVTDMGTSNFYGAPTDVAAADIAKQTAANQTQFGGMLDPTIGETVSNIGAGFGRMTEPGGFDAYAQSIGKSPMSAGMGLALPAIGTVAGMMPPPAMAEEEDSGWGPFTTSAQRRQMRASGAMKLAEGGPILNDGTGLAGLLDKRVGNEGEAGGTAEYFAAGGQPGMFKHMQLPTIVEQMLQPTGIGMSEQMQQPTGMFKHMQLPAAVMQMLQPGGINMLLRQMQHPTDVGMAKGGHLEEGAFILPADVVSHYGNGSSKAGLALLANKLNAKPIHGPGDGMSDGIPTTIEGKQKARVADGEAYISPADVKRIGGPKKLYAMMDKIREARTGTKKQGKQINPGKYLPT